MKNWHQSRETQVYTELKSRHNREIGWDTGSPQTVYLGGTLRYLNKYPAVAEGGANSASHDRCDFSRVHSRQWAVRRTEARTKFKTKSRRKRCEGMREDKKARNLGNLRKERNLWRVDWTGLWTGVDLAVNYCS